MNKKELILAGELLDLAADTFSNRVCNDLDKGLFADWTKEEKQKIVNEIEKWNSSEDYEYDDLDDIEDYPDWVVMMYLANELKGENK